MTAPRPVPAPGEDPGGSDLVRRIESAAAGIAGISDGPLAEAATRFDMLHRELQGALAHLDQA